MNFDQVKDKVAEILKELDVKDEEVIKALADPANTPFSELPIDSKDVLMLTMMIEEDYDIELDVADFETGASVKDFIEIVVGKCA